MPTDFAKQNIQAILKRIQAAIKSTDSEVCFSIRKRLTIAEVNAGAAILDAPGAGWKYAVRDMAMISIGGAVGAATTVDILGMRSSSSVKLLAVAIAVLTQSAFVRAGAANATILADGASFTDLDQNTAITASKTGSAITTATHIDFFVWYVLKRV